MSWIFIFINKLRKKIKEKFKLKVIKNIPKKRKKYHPHRAICNFNNFPVKIDCNGNLEIVTGISD